MLITAAEGGTVTSGPATLTFAPGSLPADAYVSITPVTLSTPVLGATVAYDLQAIDTTTGARIEQFNSPPVLTVAGSKAGSQIYYLSPTQGAQLIASTYDAGNGSVSAGLPHFSTYIAGANTNPQTVDVTSDCVATGVPIPCPITVTITSSSVTLTVNGNSIGLASGITSLTIDAGNEQDALTVDMSSGGAALPLTFNGGGGNDKIVVKGTNNGDEIHLLDAGSGQTTIHSDNGTFSDVTFANIGVSSVTMDPGTGTSTIAVDPLETSFVATITVNSADTLTVGTVNAPNGFTATAVNQIAAGPEIGGETLAPRVDWTPNASYTNVPEDAGASTSSSGSGMTVNITVNASGLPTATLSSFGQNYKIGDVVVFDPPNGTGTPLRVQVADVPELIQANVPVNFSSWTPSKSYTGVAPVATTQPDCTPSTGVTCTSAGTGMTVNISVDQYGQPTATINQAGTGYALGDEMFFDPTDGVGTPLEVRLQPVLQQAQLPSGFVPWTPTQNYTQVQMSTTSGAGSGMTARVTVNASGIPTLNLGAVIGTGYAVGDTVTFDPPDGIGDPITATITASQIVQQVNVNWLPNQTWNNVSASTQSGTGTGLKVDITTDHQGTPQITLVDPGTGYHPGDALVFDSLPAVGVTGDAGNTADPLMATYTFLGTITQLPGKAWGLLFTPVDVAAASTSGSGTGMVVRVSTDSSGNPTASMVSFGTGYAKGDTVTFDDPANLGDPLTVTVLNTTGPVISTRTVAPGANPTTAVSTGNSGPLTLAAPTILIGPGTQLRADAINSSGSTFAAGNVELNATAAVAFVFSLTGVLPYKVRNASATVTLDGATLEGNDISVFASASTNTFAGYDVFSDGWASLVAGMNVGDESNPALTDLTFTDGPGGNGSTITRSEGDWIADSFKIGQQIAIIGSQYNDANDYTVANVTPSTITLAPNQSLVDETDHGTATIKQVLSSILPQQTPIMTVGPNGQYDTTGTTPTQAQTGISASNLLTGLGQQAVAGNLLEDLLLPPGINPFFGVSSTATSSVLTLGTTTIDAAGRVDIESSSVTTAQAETPGLLGAFDIGVTYADSEGAATNELSSGTTITAGGDFTLLSQVTNTMASNVSVESGTIFPFVTALANAKLDTTGVKVPGPSISVSYGKARSTSSALIDAGATVNAAGVEINANNANDFDVTASSQQVAPGLFSPSLNGTSLGGGDPAKSGANQGQGIGVAVSDVASNATAEINGTVNASGSATLGALSDNHTDNTIATSVIRNTAVWENSKFNLSSIRQNPGQFGASAAITYVQSKNDAEAHIGTGAAVNVFGSLSVTSDSEDPIRAAAIGAGLTESEVAIGGAVSVAIETNHSNASVDSTVGVNVSGRLEVQGDANLPLAVLPIHQYNQLKEFIENESSPGAALFTTGDFVDAPTLVSDLTAAQPDPLSQTLFQQFTTAEQNTLLESASSTPHLTLTETHTPFFQQAGDQINFTLSLANNGNVVLTGVTITDPLLGALGCRNAAGPTTLPVTLNPGDVLMCTGSYTVTSANITAGSVTDNPSAAGTGPNHSTVTAANTATIPLATSNGSGGFNYTPISHVTLTKVAGNPTTQVPSVPILPSGTSDASSGPAIPTLTFAKVGDVLNYTLTALNDGTTTLNNVTITDPTLTNFSCSGSPASLAPGQSLTCTGTYTVTQADVNAGKVAYTATAFVGSAAMASADGFVPVAVPDNATLQTTLAQAINGVIGNGTALYNPTLFQGVTFSAATDAYLDKFDAIAVNATPLATGDEMVYTVAQGGTAIPELTAGTPYYVIKIDNSTIKLATSKANALAGIAIHLTQGSGGTQTLTENDGVDSLTFDASTATIVGGNELRFTSPDGLVDGETVIYSTGSGTAIGGLATGSTYVIHVVDPQTIAFDVPGFTAGPVPIYLPLTSPGVGTSQSFTQTVSFGSSAVKTSFPTGGDLVEFNRLLIEDFYGPNLINPSGDQLGLSVGGFFQTLFTVGTQLLGGDLNAQQANLLQEYLGRADIAAGIAGDPLSYLSAELGAPENITTTYVGAASVSGSDDPNTQFPGKAAISATFDFLSVDNAGKAWIGAGAKVNQNPAYAPPTDAVSSLNLLDPTTLAQKLVAQAGQPTSTTDPVSFYLWNSLTSAEQADLQSGTNVPQTLVNVLNVVITGGKALNTVADFSNITLSDATKALLAVPNPTAEQLETLNHLLLIDAYPALIADQSVSVESNDAVNAINAGGITALPFGLIGAASSLFGGTFGANLHSQGVGIGATVVYLSLGNSGDAYIGDGALVNSATDVTVATSTTGFIINFTFQGGEAHSWGVEGGAAYTNFTNHGYAYIAASATVNAGRNVSVSSSYTLLGVTFTRASSGGASFAVGASLGWNVFTNDTRAFIATAPGDTSSLPAGTVSAVGDVTVRASTSEIVASFTSAGTSVSGGSHDHPEGTSGETSSTENSGDGSGLESGDAGSGSGPGTDNGAFSNIDSNGAGNDVTEGESIAGMLTDESGGTPTEPGGEQMPATETEQHGGVGISGARLDQRSPQRRDRGLHRQRRNRRRRRARSVSNATATLLDITIAGGSTKATADPKNKTSGRRQRAGRRVRVGQPRRRREWQRADRRGVHELGHAARDEPVGNREQHRAPVHVRARRRTRRQERQRRADRLSRARPTRFQHVRRASGRHDATWPATGVTPADRHDQGGQHDLPRCPRPAARRTPASTASAPARTSRSSTTP